MTVDDVRIMMGVARQTLWAAGPSDGESKGRRREKGIRRQGSGVGARGQASVCGNGPSNP